MNILAIAEKASVGRTVAKYLAKTHGGEVRDHRTHIEIGSTIKVAWAAGHLFELVEPEVYDPAWGDRLNPNNLPMLPPRMKVKLVERTAPLFHNIRKLIKNADQVIHIGDPDNEGQRIVDEILEACAWTQQTKRLWTSALDDASLTKAFASMRDNSEYRGYFQASRARDHADWLYGYNASRAATISARKQASGLTFSLGRVMTPTLALVVFREEAIKSFKPTDHYLITIDIDGKQSFSAKLKLEEDDPRLNTEGLLTNIDDAQKIVRLINADKTALVTSYETSPGSLSPPLPFSLSSLQLHCEKAFGLGPAEVLKAAQSLYLKKIVTYPRTSSDYLPESQHADAAGILMALAKAPLPTSISQALRGAKPNLVSKAWNDKEQSKHSHFAIIPCLIDDYSPLESLTDDEKKVYGEIVKRYILQFWPAALFITTTVGMRCGNEPFRAEGRRFTDDGWRKAFTVPAQSAEDDKTVEPPAQAIPELEIGKVLTVADVIQNNAVTKPPTRYTAAMLLDAMKHIDKHVTDPAIKARLKESAGIGTEATRSGIIEKLKKINLIEQQSKYLVPTEAGTQLIMVLPPFLTSPDMTAMWECFMDLIIAGTQTYDQFIARQHVWLKDLVRDSFSFFDGVTLPKGQSKHEIHDTEHLCTCGSKLRHIKQSAGQNSFFGCSNQQCKKTYKDVDGMPVARPVIVDSGFQCGVCKKHSLIRRERADKSGFWWSCAGWKPENKGCNAAYQDTDGKPDYEKGAAVSTKSSSKKYGCPDCKKGSLFRLARKAPKTGHFWSCDGYRTNTCKFTCSDKDGKPDLNKGGGSSKTSGGADSGGTESKGVANRFLAAIAGRGKFGGTSKK